MSGASSLQSTAAEEREQASRRAVAAALRDSPLSRRIAPNRLLWLLLGSTLAEAGSRRQVQVACLCFLIGLACSLATPLSFVASYATYVLPACLVLGSAAYLQWDTVRAGSSLLASKDVIERVELRVRAVTPHHAHVAALALYNLPVALEVLGQFNLLWFIYTREALSVVVFVITAPVATAFCLQPYLFPKRLRVVQRKKTFKFVVQLSALVAGVLWTRLRDPSDLRRLLGPVAMSTAGMTLSMLPECTTSALLRAGMRETVVGVVTDVEATVREDAGLLVVLLKWLSDYWQLPSDFDWVAIPAILRDEVASLGCCFAKKLGQRITDMDLDGEAEPLLKGVQDYVAMLPPPPRLAAIMLALRTCPTALASLLLLVFRFAVALPALGFIAMECADLLPLLPLLRGACLAEAGDDAQQLAQQHSGDSLSVLPDVLEQESENPRLVFDPSMDGLDVLMVNSPELRRIWNKLRYAVRCLKHSLTAARICQTGAKTISLASRITSVALVVKAMREEGALSPSILRWLLQEQKALLQATGRTVAPADCDDAKAVVAQSDVVGSVRDVGTIVANIVRLSGLWQESRHEGAAADPDAAGKPDAPAQAPASAAPAPLAAAGSWLSGVAGAAARWLPAAKPESEMTEEERAAAAEKAARLEKWRQARRRMHGS